MLAALARHLPRARWKLVPPFAHVFGDEINLSLTKAAVPSASLLQFLGELALKPGCNGVHALWMDEVVQVTLVTRVLEQANLDRAIVINVEDEGWMGRKEEAKME